MLDRLKTFFRAPEAKASRTAQLDRARKRRTRALDAARLRGAGARRLRQECDRASRGEAGRRERRLAARSCCTRAPQSATRHPLLDLLARPNPRQDGAAFLEARHVASAARRQRLYRGGGGRRRRNACASSTRCGPTACGSCRARTAGPKPTSTPSAARTVRFAQDARRCRRSCISRSFHPLDDHYGLAPLEAAAVAVDTHNAAAQVEQGAARQCGAALRRAGLCRAGRRGALRRAVRAAQARARRRPTRARANAGRPLLLEGGLDWKAMSLTPKDMDFLRGEARRGARDRARLRRAADAARHSRATTPMRIIRRPTARSGAQTVLPLGEPRRLRAGALARRRRSARTCALAIDTDRIDALASDRAALWERVTEAPFLTVNEKRAAVGYAPLEGGDRARLTRHARRTRLLRLLPARSPRLRAQGSGEVTGNAALGCPSRRSCPAAGPARSAAADAARRVA